MAEELIDLLVPIVAIVTIFGGGIGVIYFFLKTRNQQRLAMIEKGLNRDMFAGGVTHGRLRRWGIALMGLGVGVLLGFGLSTSTGLSNEVAYPAAIALALGAALMLAYRAESATEQS